MRMIYGNEWNASFRGYLWWAADRTVEYSFWTGEMLSPGF